MKFIIAGYGFVGKAVDNALSNKHTTIIVDPKFSTDTIKDNIDADGLIICVGTPSLEDGSIDISNVVNVLDQVPIYMPVLIKSTVIPAVVTMFEEQYPNVSIVYSPEFLRARTANQDFLNQKYMILGGEDPANFWQMMFQSTLPNCNLFLTCSPEEACLVKYASNSFLALKTSFFNQLNDVCLNTGMDFNAVRQLVAQDSRIGTDHSMVPGLDGLRGWGGHCFPKDTTAFIKWANSVDSPVTLVEEAVKYNHKIRKNA